MEYLKKLIIKGYIDTVFKLLKKYLLEYAQLSEVKRIEGEECYTLLLHLFSAYNDLKSRSVTGVLSKDELFVENSKINDSLLLFISELPKEFISYIDEDR